MKIHLLTAASIFAVTGAFAQVSSKPQQAAPTTGVDLSQTPVQQPPQASPTGPGSQPAQPQQQKPAPKPAPKPSGDVVVVTQENFEQEVVNSPLPVIIDWWATWCGPCQATKPVFEKLAKKYAGKVKFCSIDTDDQPGLTRAAKVTSVPTFDFSKNKQLVHREEGVPTSDPADIEKYLTDLIEKILLKP